MCVFDTIITNLLACFKWPVVWRIFLKLDGLLIKFLAEFYNTWQLWKRNFNLWHRCPQSYSRQE